MKRYIVIFVYIISVPFLFSQDQIFVSPLGNDMNSGLEDLPLKSISSALVLSRKKNIKTIILRAGNYYDINVKITVADSGLVIKSYMNEQVVLYGGIPIKTFKMEGKFLVASLPENKLGWDFRMILINGGLRDRSRLPFKGFFQHRNEWNVKVLPATYGGWERKPTADELLEMRYDPKDVEIWKDNIINAEISIPHQWDESYLGVESIDTEHQSIKFTYPASNVPGAFGKKEYIVWNTRQGMSHAGQWYWDKSRDKVYYLPKENEVVDELIIPTQRNIITFEKGTNNIRLEGFTVSLSSNQLQNESFSCMGIDASIAGYQVSKIYFKNLTINATSGNGMRIIGDDISIIDTQLKNCGGGGIYFKGNNVSIENCKIDSMGVVFSGAVGIKGDGDNSLINKCKIRVTPYSAITIGCDSCRITNCTIEHSMMTMQDGSAIYCGLHKNIFVHNNLIIGNNTNHFTMGIYFDEQSNHCIAENNVVVNCGIPIHCHMAKDIHYNNNLFIDMKAQHINYGGSSQIAINQNVFIAPSISFSGPSTLDVKVDTMTVDIKRRKYANPTGVSSFQNNLILITGNPNEKTVSPKLPHIDTNLLSGTVIKNIDQSEMIDFKTLINSRFLKKYIEIEKLNLNDIQLNEIIKDSRN